MFHFKETIFSKAPGGPTFSRGGDPIGSSYGNL